MRGGPHKIHQKDIFRTENPGLFLYSGLPKKTSLFWSHIWQCKFLNADTTVFICIHLFKCIEQGKLFSFKIKKNIKKHLTTFSNHIFFCSTISYNSIMFMLTLNPTQNTKTFIAFLDYFT